MKTENIIIIVAHPTSHRLAYTHSHTYYLYPIIMLHLIAWFRLFSWIGAYNSVLPWCGINSMILGMATMT